MEILEGKIVAENIKKDFEDKIRILNEKGIIPHIAVLGICGDDASRTYIKRIEKNCEKYGIEFTLKMAETEKEFKQNFEQIKNIHILRPARYGLI